MMKIYAPMWLASAIIGVSSVALLLMVSVAYAAEFRGGEDLTVAQGETVEGDLYGGGATVNIFGTVNGDVVGGGGTVTVQGTVTGDILMGGGNMTLLGTVGDDIRAAGGNVTVGGTVTGDVIVAGGNITIAPGAQIGGDVVAAGGRVVVNGTIAGQVWMRGGELVLNAAVGDGVNAEADKVSVGADANVTGGMVYKAAEEATIADEAVIAGEVSYTEMQARMTKGEKDGNAAGIFAGIIGAFLVVKYLMWLIVALILLWLVRPLAQEVSDRVVAVPGMSILLGLVVAVVVPVLGVLLLVSIFGIALAGITFLMYGLALSLAKAFSMIVAGGLLSRAIQKRVIVDWKWTIGGSLLLTTIGLIPFIGWIIMALVYLATLGSLCYIWYARAGRWS